jgi:hypothetical protein
VVIRTEIEDPDCPHAIPSSGIEADDEDYIDHRVITKLQYKNKHEVFKKKERERKIGFEKTLV